MIIKISKIISTFDEIPIFKTVFTWNLRFALKFMKVIHNRHFSPCKWYTDRRAE